MFPFSRRLFINLNKNNNNNNYGRLSTSSVGKLCSKEEDLTEDQYFQFRKDQLSQLHGENDSEWYKTTEEHLRNASGAIKRIRREYSGLNPGESDPNRSSYQISGRIHSIRRAGKKLSFVDVRSDGQHRIQLKVNGDPNVKDARRGDFVAAEGFPCKTPAGELSVETNKVRVLSPSLRKWASNFTGWDDPNKRYRQRHLDFWHNPEKIDIFRKRAEIVTDIRDFFRSEGFLEVETPILHSTAGGASAKPFETYHLDSQRSMNLRIAPELYLKRLIIAGFDKVFEIGKQFRNEGVSKRHNPEFTTCEFYEVGADYKSVMSTTARLLRSLVVGKGDDQDLMVPFEKDGRNVVLDFKSKFNRIDFLESIESVINEKLPTPEEIEMDDERVFHHLRDICKRHNVDCGKSDFCGKVLDKLFSKLVEPELIQPTFVLHHPRSLSPLAKSLPGDEFLCERFELFIGGMELVNAYTELNNPILQRKLMLKQTQKADGQKADEDFLSALEHGMPPTGGWGLGVDRLVMLLTNQSSIKEVILFPSV